VDAENTFIYLPNGKKWSGENGARSIAPLQKTAGWQRQVRARFDAAQTTHENRRHWAAAESLSADAEASPEVRRTLRNRARYEVSNNSYAKGILLTLANDTIGTGPRLQMLTESEDLNRCVERDFMMWTTAVRLPEKLRTMRMARCQDGETFGVMGTNPKVMHDVKLDVMLIESDQVTSGFYISRDDNEIDGIFFDSFGNPISYRILKYHPGGSSYNYNNAALNIPAEFMLHCFRMDRPGLHRGISEITPALGLFAYLRRYSQAVLSAAEAAASFSGILYTDAPPNGEAEYMEPMALVELDRNMLLTLPGGWKMGQIDPKQPSANHAMHVDRVLEEILRCVVMPFNIGKGNSSGYNYASGRLDHQGYFKAIRVDQTFIASVILDKILALWLREYFLLHPEIEITMRYSLPPHTWFFDGTQHVDPLKEARGQEIRLKNNVTTFATEYALQGKDWETEIRQRAREKKLMKELGLTEEEAIPSNNKNKDKEEVTDEE